MGVHELVIIQAITGCQRRLDPIQYSRLDFVDKIDCVVIPESDSLRAVQDGPLYGSTGSYSIGRCRTLLGELTNDRATSDLAVREPCVQPRMIHLIGHPPSLFDFVDCRIDRHEFAHLRRR